VSLDALPRLASARPRARGTAMSRRLRAFPVAAFTVALALRFGAVALLPAAPAWDGVIYARAAEQLARGEGYTQRSLDPAAPARPTAFFPVGLPAVLAVPRWLGLGNALDLVLQALAGALLVPLGAAFARRAHGRRAGRYAAWALALWPGGVLLSVSYLAEPLFALGCGTALLPLLYARRRHRLRALCIGAPALGLVAYLRPTALVVLALTALSLAALAWRERAASFTKPESSARKPWLFANKARLLARSAGIVALALALGVVPLAPWMLRNARTLGAPVLVSTNGGVNLLLGTVGEGSYGAVPPEVDCPHGMREIARDRCRSQRARDRIATDPLGWIARGALKLADTFGHESAPAYYVAETLGAPGPRRERALLGMLAVSRVAWLALVALAAVGGAWIWRTQRTNEARSTLAALLVLAPIAALAALHFLYIGGDRYHAGVMPMIGALAGVGLATLRRDRA
jgi:4-amino-4-deoxy-L-arabinose transferase-like glycosyltransferase